MKTITVDFADVIGTIKPLHGVNNGPITFGALMDVSHYYQEIRAPHVRIHDPNWPHPREVDIPQIFRDEDADADDPASYDFRRTDTYIKSILDTGAKIIYRLGTSIEHTEKKYYTHPPKDFAKWAKVCTNIIRHYNQGWANGFHYGISHWEIWNEPDLGDKMWSGTFEQYMELYEVTAKAIKALDPNLKVGGYAAASGVNGMGSFKPSRFLQLCRERNLPLDLYSWHVYAVEKGPRHVSDMAAAVRKMLVEHGYGHIESHLNEWNMAMFKFARGQEYIRRQGFERLKNEVGASFCATVLTLLQDAGVDVANYYDAQPTNWFCGLFDIYGAPTPAFSGFRAFARIQENPQRVRAEVAAEDKEIACLGGANPAEKSASVLVAKFGGGEAVEYRLNLRNAPKAKASSIEFSIVDRFRERETYRPRIAPEITDEGISIHLELPEHAVVLVQLR